MESRLPQGWAEQSLLEFTTVLLLDGPCKSIFLSVISSSASASLFYIAASITEIINRPSMIIIFLGDVSDMINSIFYHMKHTAITHDICAGRKKLKENLRQGLNSVIQIEVAGIQY